MHHGKRLFAQSPGATIAIASKSIIGIWCVCVFVYASGRLVKINFDQPKSKSPTPSVREALWTDERCREGENAVDRDRAKRLAERIKVGHVRSLVDVPKCRWLQNDSGGVDIWHEIAWPTTTGAHVCVCALIGHLVWVIWPITLPIRLFFFVCACVMCSSHKKTN